MKKIIVLLSAAVLGFSCSDDDDSSSSSSTNELIGQWSFSERLIDGEVEPLEDCEEMDFIVFTDDQYASTFFEPIDGECVFDGTETFSYEVSGNSITLAFLEEGEDYTETLGFSIDGFELTLTLEEEGEVEEEIFTRMTEVE